MLSTTVMQACAVMFQAACTSPGSYEYTCTAHNKHMHIILLMPAPAGKCHHCFKVQ
jgi:hypothetical protein